MTPIANVRVQADWDRNATWAHALTDITAYVRYVDWTLGIDTPYQPMGNPCAMTLVLDNAEGDWNVYRTGAKFAGVFQPDVLVRVQVFRDGAWWHLAVLKIAAISFAPGRFGPRAVTVSCTDWSADLMGTRYDPPLTANTDTGTAVRNAIQNAGLVSYPTASMWWVMGAAALGSETRLPEYFTAGYAHIANGQTTLDYVGDNLDEGRGLSMSAFIEEMCAAEMTGRWRLEVNTALGLPYYRFASRTTIAESYDNSNARHVNLSEFESAEYTYGDGFMNRLNVTVYPRKLGSAGTELARMTSPMAIPGLGSRTLTLRYRDPDNPAGTCAAVTVIAPVASTDYTGNLAADGSGEDYTGNLVVTAVNLTNAAEVTVNNTATGTVYLTLLKIRGTPLTAQQPLELTGVDAASIAGYGLAESSITIAGVDDVELVQAYANHSVRLHSTPRARFRSVSYRFEDDTSAALALFAYEPLSFTRPLYIHDDWLEDHTDGVPYWVCGIRNVIDTSSRSWTVTQILEDVSIAAGTWKLGNSDLSVLGQTTQLAF